MLKINRTLSWRDDQVVDIIRMVQAETRKSQCNTSHEKAVVTAVKQTLALIQGPPGTGKTKVGAPIAKVLQESTVAFWGGKFG